MPKKKGKNKKRSEKPRGRGAKKRGRRNPAATVRRLDKSTKPKPITYLDPNIGGLAAKSKAGRLLLPPSLVLKPIVDGATSKAKPIKKEEIVKTESVQEGAASSSSAAWNQLIDIDENQSNCEDDDESEYSSSSSSSSTLVPVKEDPYCEPKVEIKWEPKYKHEIDPQDL